MQTTSAEALSEYRVREEYAGRVTSRRKSQLGFERGGRLERLLVDDGDRVQAGRPARGARHPRARRAPARAGGPAAPGRGPARTAKRTTHRQRQLFDSSHTSEARYDAALFDERARDAAHEAARAALASVDVALELSRIEAPYAGVLTARYADEGTVVAPGEPLFELIEDGALEARIGVPPETAASLEPGTRYDITVAGRSFEARLHATLPSVEPDTRTVDRALPPAGARAGHRGRRARARLRGAAGSGPGLLAADHGPAESRRGLWSAYVVSPASDGVATLDRRQLEVLHAEADRAFVRGTLREGERVVASGVHRLVPGQRVRVLDEPALALQ